VSYDEELANQIRALLAAEPAVAEKRMFGGLTFLVSGNMAVTASGRGGLMVRVPKEDAARLADTTPAKQVQMRGRAMTGWLYLEPADVEDESALGVWVERAVAAARALPPKHG
jgi:TfoX/Sxy family transcriptional regulator of competence genes